MSVRVLLVDSEDEARASLAKRLRRSEGIEFIGAAKDPREAAALVAQRQPDVVLVDLHRGDGQERELCRALGGLVSAPLAVLASFMTRERWEHLRAAGVAKYLLKHVDSDQLGRQLERVAERYRNWSSATKAAKDG